MAGCAAPSPAASSPAATTVATASVAANKPHVVVLQLVPRTGVTARASARVDVTEAGYTITVSATDLLANSSSFVNMHPGTCALENNETMVLVGSIAADGTGTGTVSQYYPGAYVVPAEGRILTLHGPSRSELDRVHIACVDMTG
jgi:hypothetical protein